MLPSNIILHGCICFNQPSTFLKPPPFHSIVWPLKTAPMMAQPLEKGILMERLVRGQELLIFSQANGISFFCPFWNVLWKKSQPYEVTCNESQHYCITKSEHGSLSPPHTHMECSLVIMLVIYRWPYESKHRKIKLCVVWILLENQY